MSELDPQRRAFSTGVGVNVTFRVFVCGVLVAASLFLTSQIPASSTIKLLTLVRLGILLPSPFWVPFVGGFLSAYFWRSIPLPARQRAVNLSILISEYIVLALFALLLLTSLTTPIVAVGLVYVHSGMCLKGVEQGVKFWNSRLGKQFLGNFSTRDEIT